MTDEEPPGMYEVEDRKNFRQFDERYCFNWHYRNETMKKNKICFMYRWQIFFITILRISQIWGNEPKIEYFSQQKLHITTEGRIHLECDSSDGSFSNGVREPVLRTFVLENSQVPRSIVSRRQCITNFENFFSD